MPHLFYANLFEHLQAYYERGELVHVVAPFIQADVLEGVLSKRGDRPTVVLTSWRPDHVWAGASDLRVYDVCLRHGWPLYVSDDLHAKLYSVDLSSAFVGSANVTRRGLGLAEVRNDEALCFIETMVEADRVWLLRLIQRARYVTAEFHQEMIEWLDKASNPPKLPPFDLSVPFSSADPFLISQLPACGSPQALWDAYHAGSDNERREAAEHDVALYGVHPRGRGYRSFRSELAVAFRAHPFMSSFLREVARASKLDDKGRSGMRFGAVKAWVHEVCTDVPVPYRRELTNPVANVFAWCAELLPDQVEVFKPHHSQVIRSRKQGES